MQTSALNIVIWHEHFSPSWKLGEDAADWADCFSQVAFSGNYIFIVVGGNYFVCEAGDYFITYHGGYKLQVLYAKGQSKISFKSIIKHYPNMFLMTSSSKVYVEVLNLI